MTNTPSIKSIWVARDGRRMQVIYVQTDNLVKGQKPHAIMTVLNATGRMHRTTQMTLDNFSTDKVSAFLSLEGAS